MNYEEVARIARGLTEAQRRTITTFRPEWCCSWNTQGHFALVGKGIVGHISGNCGRLTPLGLAVRAYLQEPRT